ncbi:MAG: cell wall metabolism sensor histidine kinase WalK [Lactobacillales bacterium]|jgi:two-component system sensor histidine kinase VicK|nr:cell wall metabolism sensor histidine kinase WalK [Lactobacillales bacterium]
MIKLQKPNLYSVNIKIAISFILILLISIEIMGAFFLRELEKTTITNFETTVNGQVDQLSVIIKRDCLKYSGDELNTVLNSSLKAFASVELQDAVVIDDHGVIIASIGNNPKYDVGLKTNEREMLDFRSKQQIVTEKGGRIYENYHPITKDNDAALIGMLIVKADIEPSYSEVRQTAFLFFSASILSIVICAGVAFLVSRSITTPIKEIKDAAISIADGNYSQEIEVTGKDELSDLAATINGLSTTIKNAQEKIVDDKNRLDNILFHMREGVLATDHKGNITMVNAQAERMLALKEEDALKQNIIELLELEDEYTFDEITSTDVQTLQIEREITKNRDIILQVQFSNMRTATGYLRGVVVVLHDITEQEKIDREQKEFVSNVSHELRTPLTSMVSYLEALHDGAWRDEELAPNFIDVTLTETQRLIRMVSDLLTLSRMDNAEIPLKKELVDYKDFVSFILDRYDMLLESGEQKLKIERNFELEDVWVDIDPDKMTQVIDNIINNAIKYSPDGGTIKIGLIDQHNDAVLSITDQGLGIPKKDQRKIFERFYRVDKARARAQGGTGLGLSIARDIVEAHHGLIWVESSFGRGSTFYIVLKAESFDDDWDDEVSA